jgi:hypothetical protein
VNISDSLTSAFPCRLSSDSRREVAANDQHVPVLSWRMGGRWFFEAREVGRQDRPGFPFGRLLGVEGLVVLDRPGGRLASRRLPRAAGNGQAGGEQENEAEADS